LSASSEKGAPPGFFSRVFHGVDDLPRNALDVDSAMPGFCHHIFDEVGMARALHDIGVSLAWRNVRIRQ
jgi:hypothetical protein